MSLITILIIVFLVMLIFGALPTWPYARSYSYGYYPSGILSLILIIVVVLLARPNGLFGSRQLVRA